MGDLLDLIGDLTSQLPEMSRRAQEVATRSVTSTNGSRTVRVTSVGGAVGTVEFDEPWLRSAQSDRIADSVQEALAVSARRSAAVRDEVVDAAPGLNRVRQLTESPQTLLREIGLLR